MEAEYLVKNPYGGVIFYGKEGTGVVADAKDVAEKIANFGTSSRIGFNEHPDCY